jgi:hypothetical protein
MKLAVALLKPIPKTEKYHVFAYLFYEALSISSDWSAGVTRGEFRKHLSARRYFEKVTDIFMSEQKSNPG